MVKTVLMYVLGLFMVAGGINHFVNPRPYVRMMPPYLPWHGPLVLLSGVAEVLLGVGLLVPATRVVSAWGLIALFVAIFPANLQMALQPERFKKVPPPLLWARLPLQVVLMAWAWWYT